MQHYHHAIIGLFEGHESRTFCPTEDGEFR
jgi:hypothetical protein